MSSPDRLRSTIAHASLAAWPAGWCIRVITRHPNGQTGSEIEYLLTLVEPKLGTVTVKGPAEISQDTVYTLCCQADWSPHHGRPALVRNGCLVLATATGDQHTSPPIILIGPPEAAA